MCWKRVSQPASKGCKRETLGRGRAVPHPSFCLMPPGRQSPSLCKEATGASFTYREAPRTALHQQRGKAREWGRWFRGALLWAPQQAGASVVRSGPPLYPNSNKPPLESQEALFAKSRLQPPQLPSLSESSRARLLRSTSLLINLHPKAFDCLRWELRCSLLEHPPAALPHRQALTPGPWQAAFLDRPFFFTLFLSSTPSSHLSLSVHVSISSQLFLISVTVQRQL